MFNFSTLLIDCDGVIWTGNSLIPGIKPVLLKLLATTSIVFVSNNSSKTRQDYVDKFAMFGITVSIDQIFTSAFATAFYLQNTKSVYVIGMSGITNELENVGINVLKDAPNDPMTMADMDNILPNDSVEAVVFGFDIGFCYKKLANAYRFLQNKSTLFVATNSDSTFPVRNGTLPGTGALLQSLIHPLGKNPIVIGKPELIMLQLILKKYNFDPESTCMIGDRLDTDILFGKNGGVKTMLVMTGVTSHEEYSKSQLKADFVLPSLANFFD